MSSLEDTVQAILLEYLLRNPAALLSQKNDPLCLILDICERYPEKWIILRDAGIVQMVVSAAQSTDGDVMVSQIEVLITLCCCRHVTSSKIEGIRAYGRYAGLVFKTADKNTANHRRSVTRVFKLACNICNDAWSALLQFPQNLSQSKREAFRSAVELLMSNIVSLIDAEKRGEMLYLYV